MPSDGKRKKQKSVSLTGADIRDVVERLGHGELPADPVLEDVSTVSSDLQDLDSVVAELNAISKRRQSVQDELLKMRAPDKEKQDLLKLKLSTLGDRQRECERALKLFNEGRLKAASRVSAVEIRICDLATGEVVTGEV